MITGDNDYLENLAKFNVCAEHKTPLEVAWHSETKTWFLRCATCGYPEAISHNPSPVEEYREGTLEDGPVKDQIIIKGGKRMLQRGKEPMAVTMKGVPAVDLGTGELILPEALQGLLDYAREYKLDPVRGHVVLMYGKPYITHDGYLFYANSTGKDFHLRCRPLTSDERSTYMIEDGDHAWVSEVIIGLDERSFIGQGIVTKDEMTATSKRDPTKLKSPVVAAHPWQLAQKRAEWQALRRAFPIGEAE